MKKSLKSEAVTNSFWDLISKIIEKVGSLIFTIILARFLLPEGFGVYSLTLSVALIFIGFINYSIDGALIRYVSYAIGRKNKKLASIYFKYILRKKIIFTLISSLLLILLAYPLSFYFFKKPFLFVPLFISGFYVFVLGIQSSYDALFYAFKEIKKRTTKETLTQFLKILIIIIIFSLVIKSYYVIGAIFGLILTYIIVLIFTIWYVKKFSFFIFKNEKQEFDKKRIRNFINHLLIISFVGVIFSYVDILMLGVLLPEVSFIGLYSAAVALVWGILGMLNFSSVFLPIFTQLKKINLEKGFNELLRYSLMITVPAAFGIAVLSKYIIFMVYGFEYLQASTVLLLMAFLVIEGANGTFIRMILSAREKISSMTKVSVYALFLNIILNFIFITLLLNISQLYAIVGAAIATIISRYYLFFVLTGILKKKLKIKINYLNFVKPICASLIMSFLLLFLTAMIKDMTVFWGIFLIFSGIIVYFLVLFLIKGFSKSDINFYKELYNKKFYK